MWLNRRPKRNTPVPLHIWIWKLKRDHRSLWWVSFKQITAILRDINAYVHYRCNCCSTGDVHCIPADTQCYLRIICWKTSCLLFACSCSVLSLKIRILAPSYLMLKTSLRKSSSSTTLGKTRRCCGGGASGYNIIKHRFLCLAPRMMLTFLHPTISCRHISTHGSHWKLLFMAGMLIVISKHWRRCRMHIKC